MAATKTHRDFGNRLRSLRKHKETEAQFAERMRESRQSMYRWQKGEDLPGGESLKNICTRASVAADWLLFGRGPQKALALRTDAALSADLSAYCRLHAADVVPQSCRAALVVDGELAPDLVNDEKLLEGALRQVREHVVTIVARQQRTEHLNTVLKTLEARTRQRALDVLEYAYRDQDEEWTKPLTDYSAINVKALQGRIRRALNVSK